ncbi:Asp-tRNA(Asn)/Glu-tRNA(Gln) amidotransferase subunit GatC [Marinivivus vitaminiproducens]|uniref:Asp-tRNA(Asn)/Glu-tRNA(Gln) amidotransferase subunit GatC n=1 Tax=Marinivivus vitaminiproducens TaxID=3035935 RepID=UPI0027A52C1A|nr:Asp-tRNA(Asn)/Glu-tRNA(Gln) amidotransferase subunit GatC [Geminicoccaceae bacterium SCSIO 64248]
MSLDKATVARIARLARIDVPEKRRDALAAELSNIVGWVETLNEVDTSGIEPMSSVVAMTPQRRPDAVTEGDQVDRVLANAPDSDDGYFVVPKVVE